MSQIPTAKPARYVLRDLPLSARLVISAFLISVGLGYVSAMLQLHLQHSTKDGNPLPTMQDVIEHFHGKPGLNMGTLEQLITAPEAAKWGGGPNGGMAKAFTTKCDIFKAEIKIRPEAEVRAEREGEKQALVGWIRAGAPRLSYVKDTFPFLDGMKDMAITPEFKNAEGWKIKSILDIRCCRCHSPAGKDGQATSYCLDGYEKVKKYTDITRGPSLEKLTQSTHAHLLSFSMLYGLTGLVFAFTSYPGIIRFFLAPLVLVAQMADISCWWLARLEGPIGEHFAMAIVFTGGVVGLGLVLQIVLSLLNMYGWGGKFLLVLLLAAAAYGAFVVKTNYVDPMLELQKQNTAAIKLEQEMAKKPAINAEPEKDKDNKPMP